MTFSNSKGSKKQTRVRVLFAVPYMGTGGSERVARTILQHLDRSLFEPHLALLSRGRSTVPAEVGALQLNQLPTDVQVHDLGVTRALYRRSVGDPMP